MPDLLPPEYLSAVRADQRRHLRDLVDGAVRQFETSLDARLLDSSFDQAYTLISSSAAREAAPTDRQVATPCWPAGRSPAEYSDGDREIWSAQVR